MKNMRPQKLPEDIILKIIDDYENAKMIVSDIADKYDCSHQKIYNELRKKDIPLRKVCRSKYKSLAPIIMEDEVEQPKEPINIACKRGYFNSNACVNWVV